MRDLRMIIEAAETQLQKLFGLSAEQVQRVLDTATRGEQGKKQGVFCDIYFQAGTSQGLTFDQGVLKNTSSSTTSGAGVRVVVGEIGRASCRERVSSPV